MNRYCHTLMLVLPQPNIAIASQWKHYYGPISPRCYEILTRPYVTTTRGKYYQGPILQRPNGSITRPDIITPEQEYTHGSILSRQCGDITSARYNHNPTGALTWSSITMTQEMHYYDLTSPLLNRSITVARHYHDLI